MKTTVLLTLVGVLAFAAAGAVEVTSLYTAEVPYDRTQPDGRAKAYDVALAQVLLRVSGPEVVNDVVLFDTLFPDPGAYVVQFRPGADDMLFVTFDGRAIEEVLRRAGQRVWGGDRPLTIVWLAVDWGRGSREIIAAVDEDIDTDAERSISRAHRLRERMLEIAERRGLPVAFPLLDSEDLAAVSESDIWGGFDGRVIAASQRYDANSVLIGRLRASDLSQGRWSYQFGSEQRSFSGSPESVLGQIADLLAAEFAIGGDEPVRRVELNVSGVTSIREFGQLHTILADINLVESFAVSEASGDRVTFAVDVHGGAPRLARALRFAGLVEQERIDFGQFDDDDAAASLDFFVNP